MEDGIGAKVDEPFVKQEGGTPFDGTSDVVEKEMNVEVYAVERKR